MADAARPVGDRGGAARRSSTTRNGYGARKLLTVFAVITDALAISAATRIAFVLRFSVAPGAAKFAAYRDMFLALLAVQLVVFWMCRMYDKEINDNAADVLFNCFLGSLVASATATGLIFMHQLYGNGRGTEISRMVLALRWLSMFGLVSLWRLVLITVRKKSGLLVTRVLLVTGSDNDARVVEEIERYSRTRHRVVGIVSDQPNLRCPTTPLLGDTGSLPELTHAHQVDEIIVVSDSMSKEQTVRTLLIAAKTGARMRMLPSVYDSFIGTINMRELAGIPLIEVPTAGINYGYRYVKRATDLACAAFGLLISLPVLTVASVAIKLESQGPVLFRQPRVGKGGRTYTIYKLRTMRRHSDDRDFLALASDDDPRVTRVGAFLRKRRIDEIPQLLNVIKGDMSLVGPRPPQVGEARALSDQFPTYGMRFRIRPGLTCLSHTQGRYDSAPEDRVKYDVTYLKNASLFLDLRILLDTIKVVLTGKGAM